MLLVLQVKIVVTEFLGRAGFTKHRIMCRAGGSGPHRFLRKIHFIGGGGPSQVLEARSITVISSGVRMSLSISEHSTARFTQGVSQQNRLWPPSPDTFRTFAAQPVL